MAQKFDNVSDKELFADFKTKDSDSKKLAQAKQDFNKGKKSLGEVDDIAIKEFENKQKAPKEKKGNFYDDYEVSKEDLSNTYRGAKGVTFIDKGNANDPELEYKGKTYNYWDIENALWEDFKDYAKENNIEVNEQWGANKNLTSPETDEAFNKYVKENVYKYLEDGDDYATDEEISEALADYQWQITDKDTVGTYAETIAKHLGTSKQRVLDMIISESPTKINENSKMSVIAGLEPEEETNNKFVYQFPKLSKDEIAKAKEYGLNVEATMLKDDDYNTKGDMVLSGDEENLRNFAKEVLSYELNPDYTYKYKDYDFEDLEEQGYLSRGDLQEHYEDMANYVNETLAGRGFEMPNGEYFGVQYKDGKLVAGSITNTGMLNEYEIDYDEDFSLDENLSNLYETISEENYQPESEEDNSTSLDRYLAEVEKRKGSARPFNETLDILAYDYGMEDELQREIVNDMIDGHFDKPDDKETYRDWFNRMYQFVDNATWDTLSKEEQNEYLREYLTYDELTRALSDDQIRDWIDWRGYDTYF